MPAEDKFTPDAMHFRSLRVENVRAFGSSQSIEFEDENGEISRWNLILGENGVGKTTLMWALAVMRPVPAPAASVIVKTDSAGTPLSVKAEFSDYKNEDIMRFLRKGGERTLGIKAELFETSTAKSVMVSAEITGDAKVDLYSVDFPTFQHQLRSGGPLIIGYGAGRHIGHHNLAEVDARPATVSLFADAMDLYDAEDLVEKLDYAATKDPSGELKRQLKMMMTAVASLLPGKLTADDIEIRGPRDAGLGPDRSGVHVKTPSGVVPLADLSLGYQAMFALIVDLVWRLFRAFPESPAPLAQSAIVLIDEVDLHLHPHWQRDLRRRLLETFPNVQFIATTHNPVMAQEALSQGGTVSVVRWADGDCEAEVVKHPLPRGEWSYDQVVTSDIIGFGSDMSLNVEAKLYERLKLIRNRHRTDEQEARLKELHELVAGLPTNTPSAQSLEDLMMNLAADFPSRVSQ